MNQFYFVRGTLIGLVVAFAIGYLIAGKHFLLFFTISEKFNGGVPILAGAIDSLLIAYVLDRRTKLTGLFYSGVFVPVIIFLSGAVVGAILSTAVNSHTQLDILSWFVKPIYWLALIGVPAAIAVGLVYYSIDRNLTGLKSQSPRRVG
jgi:hypothetical protein